MTDEKDAEEQKNANQENGGKTAARTSLLGFAKWLIPAVVVAVCSGGGFVLGRFVASARTSARTEPTEQDQAAHAPALNGNGAESDSEDVWYYDLEPVVACLDEPAVTRYVRATLILAVDSQMDRRKGGAFIEEQKPLLTNWLTIYLASLSLDDVRGERNLKRIQSQILDTFNEKVFPDAKPQIKRILFKEFAIQ
ncbi:MAG: flagellar basal body-associated FliL family protein [Planctomycetota bacterium]|jgi:flagellar basal body-associated protein FliL